MKTIINIAVFASGSGSNAEEIFKYFKYHEDIRVSGLLTNNPKAYAITRAEKHDIPNVVFDRDTFKDPQKMLSILDDMKIDAIVLAGFLWLIPEFLINRYSDRIVNIHPALLPQFGGKGMYGMRVHEAVINTGQPESGITIHLVNQKYDDGEIIFQAKCEVEPGDTPGILAGKIHKLEHQYYPKVIERWLLPES